MKPNLGKSIRTQTFPTCEAWHAFAEDAGLCRTFFAPQGQVVPCQSVRACLDRSDEGLRAVAVLFEQSREVGLWVTWDVRRRGVGTSLFLNAVKAQACAPLYAVIAKSNPHGVAMARILIHAGFSHYMLACDRVIGRRRVSGEQKLEDNPGDCCGTERP